MKKLIVMMFALVLSASNVFGYGYWDYEDAAKIDAATYTKDGKQVAIGDYVKSALKALIGKNSTNTSYEQLKTIVKPYDKWNSLLPSLVMKSDKFNSYIPNVIKDSTYEKYVNNYYLFNKDIFPKFDKKDWRTRVLTNFESNASKNKIDYCTNAVNFYNNNMKSFTDAEIKEDMKAFKRIVYPKIGDSDAWKQLAVKIELMLKSVE